MKTTLKTAVLAATLISTAGTVTVAQADEIKGKCHGANACKGQSACVTAGGSCAGTNSCKGKGWLAMNKSSCEDKGGKFEPLNQ